MKDGVYELTIFEPVGGFLGKFDGNCDGVGGDNYTLTGHSTNDLFRLFGDGNGDGRVDSTDFTMFRVCFGVSGYGPGYNLAFDYDGDGNINSADFAEFRLRFGLHLF